jgi:osmoprotectant transport system ATP-binding protein
VTHDLREAIELADRIAVMHKGRVEQYAVPATLLAAPATDYVTTLLERAHVR